ncbi:unnamed protein product [Ilex paraguariensis]
MEFYEVFSFVGILRESITLLSKNGKLKAFVTTLSLLLYTLFFFLNIFSVKPLIFDLVEVVSGGSDLITLMAHVKDDLGILLVVEYIFICATLALALYTTTATIFISATSYCSTTMSIKDLVLKVARSWKRPFITGFYTTLLGIGYISVLMVTTPTILMISDNLIASKAIVIIFAILGAILSLPLTAICVLALVISVMEEDCYGIEALGKAGKLVKGNRVQCFILSLLFMVAALILYQCFRVVKNDELLGTSTILIGLFRIYSLYLVNMFQFMTYTVVYFRCKKNHGEEMELQWSTAPDYMMIKTTLLDNKDTP